MKPRLWDNYCYKGMGVNEANTKSFCDEDRRNLLKFSAAAGFNLD